MKRFILITAVLAFIVTSASAQRFRGGGFRGGGVRGGYGYHGGGYRYGGYGGYRSYGGLSLGLGLGFGLGYGYYNPYYYGYPYYNYPYYSPYYTYPPVYEDAPRQSNQPPADSYDGSNDKGGYYNNDTVYSQKPATLGPGPTDNGNNSSSRKWVAAHWKHTDEGWIWIDGYWKNQQ